ncbi:Hypothetical protein GSB_151086 [Giardia duodenalis]|uniref:Uncharacterized protein n=2 Tax=Giardia intestinalis TaxID=5741 RepID=C6LYJ5_GIAIB|nr:Hypothetical protein GL50581_3872 [Giardia intestinalis ATCC 50581]ESU43614.1 Hypothetical protein GSB_151086 [Giardia intestinalis]
MQTQTYKISEMSQLSTPHPAPSSAPSSRGIAQRTKGALSPMKPSCSSIRQSPIQRSTRRPSNIGTVGTNAQKIPTVALAGALSGLDAPTTMHQEDIEILTEGDVIGELDFVSMLTNRKLSYTQSHSICEPAATPGAVLTDVFRGLREQNAKIVKTLNLLITAGKKNKAAIADLEAKLGDITAATNTLITSTRSFKAELLSTDTNIKATRNHMLLVQDQLKQLTTSVSGGVSGEQKKQTPHSYNIYGRVYGNTSNVPERAPTPTDNNALTLSALGGEAGSPSPSDQVSRCLVMIKNETDSNTQQTPMQGYSTTQVNTKASSNLFNSAFGLNVSPSRKINITAKEGAGRHMPAALRSPQLHSEQSKATRVPLATPMESMEAREGQGHEIDLVQKVDMLERNLRQITKHLSLTWLD